MSRISTPAVDAATGARLSIAVLTAALLGVMPSAAFPQTTVPTREGNIWGGLDHQPQQAQVARDEKAAGVAASPAQQDATARTVDELYQYLMRGTSPHAG